MMQARRQLLVLSGLLPVTGITSAQATASQLRLLVPYAPGGAADALARAIAGKLGAALSSAIVIVDNRPGGGTVIATQAALQAPTDGQTLLLVGASFLVQPDLLLKHPYDALKNFSPVMLSASNAHLLAVHPSVPAANLREFITWAKANAGKVAYASFGRGSSGHMNFELLKKQAGIDLIHVPYNGGAPAMQALVGGQVSAMLTDLPPALPFVQSGKLKALAVGSPQRDPSLPAVPTFTEAGLAGFESESWFGFVVRSGTNSEQVHRLNAALTTAIEAPDLKKTIAAVGLRLIGGTPQRFGAHLDREAQRLHEALSFARVEPE